MNRKELIEHYRKPSYIGDSVYIHFDGYHFILETRNGNANDPSNRIALDPDVIRKLLNHKEQVYADFRALVEKEKHDSKTGEIK